jgi:hypothetical protein
MSTRTVLAAVLAPVFLLTGCGGGTSIADPPVSPPTNTSTPPPHKRETPEHFIRRWAAEDTTMQTSGKTAPFLRMTRACEGCEAVASHVKSAYAAGGWIHTKGWTLLKAVKSNGPHHTLVAELFVDSAPTTYAESAGASPGHFSGGREHFQITLVPTPSTWVIVRFVEVAS